MIKSANKINIFFIYILFIFKLTFNLVVNSGQRRYLFAVVMSKTGRNMRFPIMFMVMSLDYPFTPKI